MTPNYLPSDILLTTPPLIGTMKKAEIEHAATLYICACKYYNDKWEALSQQEIAKAIRYYIDNKIEPIHSCGTNPFFRPCFYSLIHSEFGQKTNDGKIILTENAFRGIESRRLHTYGVKTPTPKPEAE